MLARILLLIGLLAMSIFAQAPPIEPGVSQELAKWRAAQYSDVRYKLNLTLEKMSPVLKGTIEIRVRVGEKGSGGEKETAGSGSEPGAVATGFSTPIVLDWRRIKGHEDKSTISNVSINGRVLSPGFSRQTAVGGPPEGGTQNAYEESNEHLIFRDGVVLGENVIKLDFTSPILTSGSAITRYVDKEDGSEYIYSLFVPSDASTAFPIFDQPDLKARFSLSVSVPGNWNVISNTSATVAEVSVKGGATFSTHGGKIASIEPIATIRQELPETKPISTYVFAFAAGPWEKVSVPGAVATGAVSSASPNARVATAPGTDKTEPPTSIYVRRSQAAKFKPHAAEVFRLNREAIKYFEQYFDYKFPFPKYDLVLIPEFPFGGMEHAGATFLRESSIIFPQEPTKNDHISRALLMFHEASHQWFGDTVTMRWFDDLWLKEGFATFTAYKAMEKIMPEMNAWKVFYERVKQAAYQTDSTKGTTPIYQEIPNLSAAKSAYGNIVYNKAPAFLRQAEFYLGEDKFQAAVRAFLKKHEFGNAGWEDLVSEFESATGNDLNKWANGWVKQRGLLSTKFSSGRSGDSRINNGGVIGAFSEEHSLDPGTYQERKFRVVVLYDNGTREVLDHQPYTDVKTTTSQKTRSGKLIFLKRDPQLIFPNYQDYGYGIFLLDDKSRDYVLKNIQNEKDPFLRSMMWGALWDSVREGELDPKEYVKLVVKVLGSSPAGGRTTPSAGQKATGIHPSLSKEGSQAVDDESTVALLLGRVSTAMRYYIDPAGPQAPLPASAHRTERSKGPADAGQAGSLRSDVEDLLIERMQNAGTLGQRITFYRAFLNVAASDRARGVLKGMLKADPLVSSSGPSRSTTPSAEAASTPPNQGGEPESSTTPSAEAASTPPDQGGEPERSTTPSAEAASTPPNQGGELGRIPLKAKDKFDIVTRLIILGDPEGIKLLAELEKTETSDDARRWAYAARAGVPTVENKAKYWNDFVSNKDISESWIEAAFGPWNSTSHSELTLPYLQRALAELPNHKRNRKIFFVNGWLGSFIGGQRSEEALAVVNKFLADNPSLDRDLRLKVLENVDVIERAVKIRGVKR